MNRKGPLILFAMTACLAAGIDLWSKSFVHAWVEQSGEPSIVLVEGWFEFERALNNGGMWSFGHQFGGQTNWVLALIGSAVVLAILWLAVASIGPGNWGLATILGAILGGAIGNLHDRLVFGGVRDFILVHIPYGWGVYRYPTFNIADSCLVVGLILWILVSLRTPVVDAEVKLSPAPAEG